MPEMIVYVAVLTIIFALTIQILVLIGRSYSRMRSAARIERSAGTALERLIREANSAKSVNIASSTLGSHPGRLSLSVGTTTTDFYLQGSALALEKNGAPAGFLTPGSVSVANFVVYRLDSGLSNAVRVELTLESGEGNSFKSQTFYAGAILKNSYEK